MNNKKNSTPKPLKKRSRTKRVLAYTGVGVALILGGGGGFLAYEYHHLQPKNYITTKTRPVLAGGSKKTNVGQANGTFNMLLIGSDARAAGSKTDLTNAASHSDSMILVHADLNKHRFNLVSIPRDTRVYMAGYGYTKLTSVQYMDQVNHGEKQGIIDAVKAISQLTGVPINYYAETNYSGLQNMVNAVGGITIKLPFPVTINHAWYPQDNGKFFSKGSHFVKGRMAFEIVHTRYGVPGTDFGRQRLQKAALVGIAKKVMSPGEVTRIPALLKSLHSYLVATNMSKQLMLSIGLGMKGHFSASKDIHYDQLKGPSKTVYNSVLQAYDDEVILPKAEIQKLIKKDFS
ncbi:LCP family protein [Alicyclobacillus sp. SO9]|uniref:LCP family protein n=1 Tax=Alicyclobacillus sp. SO9 TaxID=2665646 RepID=UPI0018E87435|nr:LCP family protein [Alicyclobacillus sp. SO9]QQE79222.1 LCP family protein [Alicyclobacillus sp. SO9]